MAPVDVVPQHDDEIEANFLPVDLNLLRNVVLLALAGAAVADHSEAHRLLFQRKLQLQSPRIRLRWSVRLQGRSKDR